MAAMVMGLTQHNPSPLVRLLKVRGQSVVCEKCHEPAKSRRDAGGTGSQGWLDAVSTHAPHARTQENDHRRDGSAADSSTVLQITLAPVVPALVNGFEQGRRMAGELTALFHEGCAAAWESAVCSASERTGVRTVALSDRVTMLG